MKFLLFDRIVHHEPGKSVVAEFDVPPPAHDAYSAHFPKKPRYPHTLIVESMVQVLGWLAMEAHGYRVLTVLAGFDTASAYAEDSLTPGESKLKIDATLEGTNKGSSIGSMTCENEILIPCGHAERVLLAHIPHDDPDALRARFQEHVGAP